MQIIGHEYIRHAIVDLDVVHHQPFTTAIEDMPVQVDALKKQIAEEKDPAKRADLDKQLAAKQADWEELKTIKPTPPTMTYTSKMTLYQGQREIQLLHLGRGHTQGDTVVYLPKEKIVCSGDLMETQPAYMGDALFDEWIKTLDALKELDFTTDLPGHGVPFHDKVADHRVSELSYRFHGQGDRTSQTGPHSEKPRRKWTSLRTARISRRSRTRCRNSRRAPDV